MSAIRFQSILIMPQGIRACNPLGLEQVVKTGEIDSDPLFFKKYNLTGTLTFIKDDFAELYKWERSNKRCEKVILIVKQLTPTGEKEIFRQILGPDYFEWNA